MATASPTTPNISLTISLDPRTYSFTDPHPPTLFITLLSHSATPVTLFTFHKPLDPAPALTQEGFILTDLSTSPPSLVPQDTIRLQRLPISRARGSGDERYFITLYPATPLTLSHGFATGGGEGWRRPQPKHVVEKGQVVDENGDPTGARCGTRGSGVNGLESGKRYKVDVNRKKLGSVWWKWCEKEDVLVEPGDRRWNLFEVESGEGEVRWEIGDGVEFEVV
ncbi:MAG: hypothetical protein Q9206_001292 [Seirophora lacunosa]